MDHGLEPPDERVAAGKPRVGNLILAAVHEGNQIIISIKDDGRGIDTDRVGRKALEKGLVTEDQLASMSQRDLFDLIFLPGFSTKEKASDLSGRGVGMDVVRRNIDELRGSIEVDSYEGSGTTLRIRLPLTLAIIDGFRVAVEDASYVVPLHMVIECLDLGPFLESEENHLINLRGEVLPFLRLRDVFRLSGARPARERVVVVEYGEIRAGIVVDRLLGEFQTVIKPLGQVFQRARGLGGSTILGSGEVGLILDIPQLLQLASSPAPGRNATPFQATAS